MKVALTGQGVVALAGVVAAVLLLAYASKKAGQAAAAINPASADNLVNQAVTGTGRALSGDSAWTLGGWLYEITHADPLAAPPVNRGQPMTPNPIYGAVNRAGAAVSGDRSWTLGGWFYDLTHEEAP